MLGREVLQRIKASSSTNEENARKALQPSGWSPNAGDTNPTLTLDLIADYPVMEVKADVRNIEEAEVLLLNDDVVVSRKPAEVRVCSYK